MVVVTNTGGRPEAFALCVEYMRRQTYGWPVHWVIAHDLDDVPVPAMPANWTVSMVRAPWTWRRGQNTQAKLLLLALDSALILRGADEPLVVVEDDDWYSPSWLDVVADGIRGVDVFGEREAVYYNVRSMAYRRMRNRMHASLCSTAVNGRGVEALLRACERVGRGSTGFIDLSLWSQPGLRHRLVHTDHVVGIKGMPGRAGIGSGHRVDLGNGWVHDPDALMLRELIGDDVRHYVQKAAA